MRRLSALVCIAVSLCSIVAGGCRTYTAQDTELILSLAMSSARSHLDMGREQEAVLLVAAVAEVDPEFPGVQEIRRRAARAFADADVVSLLGANRPQRYEVSRPLWARVLLWPVDRWLDAADMVSFGIHLGYGVYADLHATRAVQLCAGYRYVAEAGWLDNRCFGGQVRAESGLNLLWFGAQASRCAKSGTSGERVGSLALAGVHDPTLRYYQDYADYWAIGASATCSPFPLGLSFDIHPVEIADFLAGFVGIDFLHDDFADTRGLDLRWTDTGLLMDISNILSSEEALADYRRHRAFRAKGAGK